VGDHVHIGIKNGTQLSNTRSDGGTAHRAPRWLNIISFCARLFTLKLRFVTYTYRYGTSVKKIRALDFGGT